MRYAFILPGFVAVAVIVGTVSNLGYHVLWLLGAIAAISFAASFLLIGAAVVVASVQYVRDRRRERRFRRAVEAELEAIFADEEGLG